MLAPAALAWLWFHSRGREITGLHLGPAGLPELPARREIAHLRSRGGKPWLQLLCVQTRVRSQVGLLARWWPDRATAARQLAAWPLPDNRIPWDWAGNSSALDDWITAPLAHATSPPNGQVIARFDFP